MSPADWPRIERALEQGLPEDVVAACATMDEEQRAALASRCRAAEQQFAIPHRERHSPHVTEHRRAQHNAVGMLLLCLADVGDARFPRGAFSLREEWIEPAVLQRPKEWRDRWIAGTLWKLSWDLLRKLILNGSCEKPEDPAYLHMMARFVGYLDSPYAEHRDIYQGLLCDPELLKDDVYRIFEIDGLGADQHTQPTEWQLWSPVLLKLAGEGRLDRGRLLAGVLAGLRPTVQARTAREFAGFHGRLRPSIKELAERSDVYLGLLESPNDAAVELAVRSLQRLAPTRYFDANAVLHRLSPALTSSAKGTATRAAQLAGTIITAHPALARDALAMLLLALGHGSADVQGAVLDALEAHQGLMDAPTRAQLVEVAPLLDPAVRSRAAKLSGATPKQRPGDRIKSIEVPPFTALDLTRIPKLEDGSQIDPVADLAELLDLSAIVLERQDDPVALERWCDGVARFCDQPVDAGRQRALLKRARRPKSAAFIVIAVVTHYWLTGDRMWSDLKITEGRRASWWPLPSPGGLAGLLVQRVATVVSRCERRHASPLLSAPTHHGGWINPTTLVRRLEEASLVWDHDLALALLRLPLNDSAPAIAALSTMPGEAAVIARAALGDEVGASEPDTTLPASWSAASEIRAWVARNASTHGPSQLGPSAEQQSLIERLLPGTTGNPLPASLDLRRWTALVWPANHAPLYDAALRLRDVPHYLMTIKQRETLSVTLEPMLDPDEPLENEALNLLAYALGTDSDNRLQASEVLTAAIATRRLDAAALGRLIAANISRGGPPPDRWVDGLRGTASVGPLHAHQIQLVLESTFAELDASHPRTGASIDLLRVLAQDANARVTNLKARRWLESIPPRTRAGTSAAAALAVGGDGAQAPISPPKRAREAA